MQAETSDSKQIFQQKVEAQLDKLDTQIVGLQAKVAQAKMNAKIKHYDKVGALTAKQQEAQAKLQLLKSAEEDVWLGRKISVESALHELQDIFNNALAQFKQANSCS